MISTKISYTSLYIKGKKIPFLGANYQAGLEDLVFTHLSRINSPISIGRTSLFQILGVLGGIFHFYSISNKIFCEQTVGTLIWVCAVSLCPTRRTLGLYGLKEEFSPFCYVALLCLPFIAMWYRLVHLMMITRIQETKPLYIPVKLLYTLIHSECPKLFVQLLPF